MAKNKRRTRVFSLIKLDSIAIVIVACFLAYYSATKIQYCNEVEKSLVGYTLEILEHSVCNTERIFFQTYGGLDCDALRGRLSDKEANLRWWGCMFSAVSILQVPTTWLAIAVLLYISTVWFRYINTNSAPVASQQPTVIFVSESNRRRIRDIPSQQSLLQEFTMTDDSSEESVEIEGIGSD